MRKITDLSGKKFGKLTVLKIDMEKKQVNRRRVYYICRCDCGNIKSIRSDFLKNGSIVSCGCYHKCDVTGNRYGRLIVIKRIDYINKTKDRERYKWLCKCDCGNIVEVARDDLRDNRVRSCGCLHKEVSSKNGKKGLQKNFEKNCMFNTSLRHIDNPKLLKNNKSGKTGVFYISANKKWQAVIEVQKKRINLGYFKEKEDAIKARLEGEEKYFKPLIKRIKENKTKYYTKNK